MMPLLHKKPFVPEPVPRDLRPSEEVFVCRATKEVFRDYEKFFNRHFLCNSLVWTCQLTGTANLTFEQAANSEAEAKKAIDSVPVHFQKAALTLVHHTRRTNVKTVTDEICAFFKERFVVGETVDLVQLTNTGTKVVSQVTVLSVSPPQPKPVPPQPKPLPSPSSSSLLPKPHPLSPSLLPKPPSPSSLLPKLSPPLRVPVISIPPLRAVQLSPTKVPLSPLQSSRPLSPSKSVHHSPAKPPPTSHASPAKSLPPPPPLIPVSVLHAPTPPTGSLPFSASAETGGTTHSQLPNGLPNKESALSADSEATFRTPKVPPSSRTQTTPLSREVGLNPGEYKYVVKLVQKPETRLSVFGKLLSRPKGTINPKKLKLLLRNALYKPSEKHALLVKEEFVERFVLGPPPASVLEPLPSPSPRSRKRTLSQSSIDAFLTSPSASSPVVASPKKPRPSSLETTTKPKPRRKSDGVKAGRTPKTPRKSRTPKASSAHSTSGKKASLKLIYGKSATTPKSPHASKSLPRIASPKVPHSPIRTPKTPRGRGEALKALNKAKKYKQLDLKKSVVKSSSKGPLTEADLAELRRRAESERLLRIAQLEAEKERRKAVRLARLRETQELRRQERLRQREMLRPREDLLCQDSKPLPVATKVASQLTAELFGDAVMLLEFLQTFGPLFNIREAIREGITFDKIELALVSSDTSTLLFDITRFLLQAIFATMEEEKESYVESARKQTAKTEDKGGEGEGKVDEKEDEGEKEEEEVVTKGGEKEEEEEVVTMEGEEEVEMKEGDKDSMKQEHFTDEEIEGNKEKPLDIRVEAVRSSANTFSRWSRLALRLPLADMVLDQYTCTEVLRLHLLSSGGYADAGDRTWFRYCRRGGYCDGDDPAIALQLSRPDIFERLRRVPFYDLSAADKLKVLSTLCSQLLSYSVSRELIEESVVRVKKAQRRIREIRHGEERRRKEAKAARLREKKKEQLEGKQRSSGEGLKASVTNGVTTASQSRSEASRDTSAAASNPQGRRSKSHSPKSPPGPLDPMEKGGVAVQPSGATTPALDYEEEERLEGVKVELGQLYEELAEASAIVNLRPIGSDRHHRHYWLFPSLPGLFVEDCRTAPDPGEKKQPPLPSEASQKPVSVQGGPLAGIPTRYLPTSLLSGQAGSGDFLAPLAPPPLTGLLPTPVGTHCIINLSLATPTVTVGLERAQHRDGSHDSPPSLSALPLPPAWSYYSSVEDVESLIASLNPRGVRELELRTTLEHYKSIVLANIEKCPFAKQRASSPAPHTADRTHSGSADHFLELYLREQILDIEEKIYIGNLGFLKAVESRMQWRDAIETSGAAAALVPTNAAESSMDAASNSAEGSTALPPLVNETSRPASPPCDSDKSGQEAPAVNPSIQELAAALLQVQAGLAKKFLMAPLGFAVDTKKTRGGKKSDSVVRESDTCLEEWRAFLGRTTSFSQIFVHLATLERAVMWSRSLMLMRCRICRRKGGDEFMLLCDGCDHGYHMYCLRPPLQAVPEGDWFCNDCVPVTPVKPRRRVQRVVVQVDSSESESERDDDSDEEESEEEEEEEEEEEPVVAPRRGLRSHLPPRRPHRGVGRPPGAAGKRQVRKRVAFSAAAAARGKKRPGKAVRPEPPRMPQDNPRARKKLKLDEEEVETVALNQSKVEGVIAAIIDLRGLQGRKPHTNAARRELRGLEMQLCEALWEELSCSPHSWPFASPVSTKEYPDYFDVISSPMNLRAVRNSIKRGQYDNVDNFVRDVHLIFSNCLKYHKRHSEVGRAGAALKKFFEKRCSDLGLKDLFLCRPDSFPAGPSATPTVSGGLRSSARLRK